jgi:hypothetical protein
LDKYARMKGNPESVIENLNTGNPKIEVAGEGLDDDFVFDNDGDKAYEQLLEMDRKSKRTLADLGPAKPTRALPEIQEEIEEIVNSVPTPEGLARLQEIKKLYGNQLTGEIDLPLRTYPKTFSDTKDPMGTTYQDLIKELEGKAQVKNIPNQTDLINEAKKYKSAEEFVKAQGDPLSEFKSGIGIKDPDIARGTVKEAIQDIGGMKNVQRGKKPISEIVKSENINTLSERYKGVLEQVKKGERTPIIIDQYGEIYDGHHRLEAYREIGLREIPVVAPKGTEMITYTKSQLIDIWKRATGK